MALTIFRVLQRFETIEPREEGPLALRMSTTVSLLKRLSGGHAAAQGLAS